MTTSFIRAYREKLQAEMEQAQAEHARKLQVEADEKAEAERERLTSLELRVKKLLADIPRSVQEEGISLPAIQNMLVGRTRGNAHPGEIGAALRKLGWTRERRWRGKDIGFKAVWYPPHPGAHDS